jgi:hypothetical protein
MSEGKGHLLHCGALLSCQAYDSEGGVHHFEFHPPDVSADVLPLAAPRQVCHPALKAAVEQDPTILVQQRQGLHSVYKGSPVVHTGVCSCLLEGSGAECRAGG